MPRNRVTDMDFDEVSTVDIPANQHGLIVLAKSATSQEDTMADFVDEQGNPLEGQLMQDTETGAVVFQTTDGDVFDIDSDDFADMYDGDGLIYDGEQERELEAVGKSAFLQQVDQLGSQVYGQMSEDLSKALDEAGRDDVLAKAFAAQQAELAELRKSATDAIEIAKAAQDREMESRFISKAADYDATGVAPEVLGPILKRMSETLPYDDCAVVAAIFERQSDIFKQFGVAGGEGFDNPLAEIEDFANANSTTLAKSYNGGDGRTELTKEQGVRAAFDANPRLYDEMKRNR